MIRFLPVAAVLLFASEALAAELIVTLGRGTVWKRHAIDATSKGADGVKLGDVNGDGLPDLVTGWEEGNAVRIYLHPGAARSREPWPQATVGRVRSAEDALFVDLDGDGKLEVVSLTEGKTRSVFWHRFVGERGDLLNPQRWETAAFPAIEGKQMWMQALTTNVDRQNGDDLILASKGEGATIGWLQAPEKPTHLADWTYHPMRAAGWIMSLALHDMNADGYEDVLFTDRKGSRRGVYWLANPGGREPHWEEHLIGAQGREVMFADIADMNGDRMQDVVVAVKPLDVVIFLRQADGTWKEQAFSLVAENLGDAKAVKAADLNGDGLMDLLFSCEHANGPKEGIVWLEQTREGSWTQHSLGGPEGLKYDLMQVLDLDKDGDLDVITCEERDQLGVIWYENPFR